MFPIMPENAPRNAADIARITPIIICKIANTVIPVGLSFPVLSLSTVLFVGAVSGLPHAGQKFSSVTSLPQLGQNPNVI